MSIHQKIWAWIGNLPNQPHERGRSWENCYRFFQRLKSVGIGSQRDRAALELGFYLASWGMYRGSSFLLQYAYTVHLGVIDLLATPSLAILWEKEFGSEDANPQLVSAIREAIKGTREVYSSFGEPSDILVTRVLLGTLGCLPTCDRYFLEGFHGAGYHYSCVDTFIDQVFRFCRENVDELQQEQANIERTPGITMHYPLMKLVDMYFHRLGQELEEARLRRLGVRIRQLREAAGLSLEQLAGAVPVSVRAMGQWEQGEREPTPAHLRTLAKVLRVDRTAFSQTPDGPHSAGLG
jgi:DNA-binding transcriptional regulator YiaG